MNMLFPLQKHTRKPSQNKPQGNDNADTARDGGMRTYPSFENKLKVFAIDTGEPVLQAIRKNGRK